MRTLLLSFLVIVVAGLLIYAVLRIPGIQTELQSGLIGALVALAGGVLGTITSSAQMSKQMEHATKTTREDREWSLRREQYLDSIKELNALGGLLENLSVVTPEGTNEANASVQKACANIARLFLFCRADLFKKLHEHYACFINIYGHLVEIKRTHNSTIALEKRASDYINNTYSEIDEGLKGLTEGRDSALAETEIEYYKKLQSNVGEMKGERELMRKGEKIFRREMQSLLSQHLPRLIRLASECTALMRKEMGFPLADEDRVLGQSVAYYAREHELMEPSRIAVRTAWDEAVSANAVDSPSASTEKPQAR